MVLALFQVVDFLLRVLGWVIIAQVILSWLVAFNVLNTSSQGLRAFVNALDRILEPLYRPIRRIMPDFGGIDFSPLVLLLLIQVVRMLLGGVATEVAYSAA
jgi:YggT family protein